MKTLSITVACLALGPLLANGCGGGANPDPNGLSFYLPDTNQLTCYDSAGSEVPCSGTGQDGEFAVDLPSYTDHGDGTLTDDITGVMWQQSADTDGDGTVDVADKFTQADAVAYCQDLELGGHDDWELPDIKTLYSLIDFSGEDVSGLQGDDTSGLNPFIDDEVFGFGYGDTSAGERIIDAQWATTSLYAFNAEQMFGVNLADGRIKGYGDPMGQMPNNKLFYVQCVRDVGAYGVNDFADNADGTITDRATGLVWEQADNGAAVDWDTALSACAQSTTGGHADWRLPDAKQLQSIVDYTRSPDTTDSAAIDPMFQATQITNEDGQADYGFYWTSTTHKNMTGINAAAAYVSFGRALGYMNGQWLDVHGAGAQRSDPKDVSTVPIGQEGYLSVPAYDGTAISHGPQGDVVRGLNFVRCVRDVD